MGVLLCSDDDEDDAGENLSEMPAAPTQLVDAANKFDDDDDDTALGRIISCPNASIYSFESGIMIEDVDRLFAWRFNAAIRPTKHSQR